MNNPGWLINAVCLWSLNTSCAKDGGGVLETDELTVPIPAGYRSVSDAKSEAAATLVRPGHSRIAIMRVPRSHEDDGTPPTSEKCVRRAMEFATKNKETVVTGGTLVEHSAKGLGRSCQFTVSWGDNQFSHAVAAEWGVLCMHPPGEGAVCETIAAGVRRR